MGRKKIQGHPTKWATIKMNEDIILGKAGLLIKVGNIGAKKQGHIGQLTISIGGIKWQPYGGGKRRTVFCKWGDLENRLNR